MIDKVEPFKERRIKHKFQELLNCEIFEAIKNRDKLFRKLKKSRTPIDKELYNVARYNVQKVMKKVNFENKLNEFIGKPESTEAH